MSKRILIIDDEPNIVISLEFLMERAGYDVRTAYDGEIGLMLARTYRPDLILLDVMMPKLDGYAVLEAVRADPFLDRVRILMLTAKDRRFAIDKGLLLGADACMPKPFSTSGLVEKVKELLGDDQEQSPSNEPFPVDIARNRRICDMHSLHTQP
jgi:DNA-binding response OmpR family regulator